MKPIHIGGMKSIPRRAFLLVVGVTRGLPLLEATMPPFARAGAGAQVPRRVVAIETNMGIMPKFFFPEQAGRDYALTPYLVKRAAHRANLSVFTGASHPGVTGGHAAVLLAGGGFKHGQHVAFNKDNNYPRANLYALMLQRTGIHAEKFATSTGTFRGLELA